MVNTFTTLIGTALLTVPILVNYLIAKRHEPDRGLRSLMYYATAGAFLGAIFKIFDSLLRVATNQSFIFVVLVSLGGAAVTLGIKAIYDRNQWLKNWYDKRNVLPKSRWQPVLFFMGIILGNSIIRTVSTLSA